MLNLIKAEIYKLRHQRLPIILFIIVIAISIFSAFSEINLLGNLVTGKMSFANAFQDIFMLFVIAIFGGFYIGSDFSNRTIQTELSKGLKRLDIILSKACVFSISSSLIMLLYPVTVCLIHTIKFGWGEAFDMLSIYYLLRVALLGSILNIGTASIYVCFAFLCRDIPKTICICFAFPVVFSAISNTLGKQFLIVDKLLNFSTLSQLKYIVGDKMSVTASMSIVLSTCITIIIVLLIANYFFSKAEIR